MNIDIFMIRSTCRFITHPTKLHRLDNGRGVAGTKQTTTEQTMPPSLCHRTASCPSAPLGSAGATGGGGSGTVEQRRRSVGLPWGRGPGRALHGWRGQRVAFPAGWQALWGGGWRASRKTPVCYATVHSGWDCALNWRNQQFQIVHQSVRGGSSKAVKLRLGMVPKNSVQYSPGFWVERNCSGWLIAAKIEAKSNTIGPM